MVSRANHLVRATAPAASLRRPRESKPGRALRDSQHSGFGPVSVHLKELTASFLQFLCLIFLHMKFF